MTELFWIGFRCISRQGLNMDFKMISQVSFRQFAAMSARTIPNHHKGSTHAATKMLQALNQFFGIDRTFETLLEDPSANAEPSHARDLSTILSDPFQLWSFSTRCPSRTNRFSKGNPKFIFEDDLGAEPLRFFLSWPNPCSTRLGSAPRPVPGHVFRVSARSNPDHAVND
jgi:hypothetical protein